MRLDYFLVTNPKLNSFYLFPKIHKILHNVPGIPVRSKSSYFSENISTFLFPFETVGTKSEILY